MIPNNVLMHARRDPDLGAGAGRAQGALQRRRDAAEAPADDREGGDDPAAQPAAGPARGARRRRDHGRDHRRPAQPGRRLEARERRPRRRPRQRPRRQARCLRPADADRRAGTSSGSSSRAQVLRRSRPATQTPARPRRRPRSGRSSPRPSVPSPRDIRSRTPRRRRRRRRREQHRPAQSSGSSRAQQACSPSAMSRPPASLVSATVAAVGLGEAEARRPAAQNAAPTPIAIRAERDRHRAEPGEVVRSVASPVVIGAKVPDRHTWTDRSSRGGGVFVAGACRRGRGGGIRLGAGRAPPDVHGRDRRPRPRDGPQVVPARLTSAATPPAGQRRDGGPGSTPPPGMPRAGRAGRLRDRRGRRIAPRSRRA